MERQIHKKNAINGQNMIFGRSSVIVSALSSVKSKDHFDHEYIYMRIAISLSSFYVCIRNCRVVSFLGFDT